MGGGAKGGANSQQAHDVVTTSMRRNDVASTSFRRRVPTRFLINQCQIITFLILKYDIIENSRIDLRGIVLPVQVGGLLGGPKGMLAPPLKLLGGGACPPAPPPPPPPTTGPLFLRLCYSEEMSLKDADEITIEEKSDQGLHCKKTRRFYGKIPGIWLQFSCRDFTGIYL